MLHVCMHYISVLSMHVFTYLQVSLSPLFLFDLNPIFVPSLHTSSFTLFSHPQAVGVCVTRKPWLLIVEFMAYKDLGFLLKQAKKHTLALRLHEFSVFALQLAQALAYLASV